MIDNTPIRNNQTNSTDFSLEKLLEYSMEIFSAHVAFGEQREKACAAAGEYFIGHLPSATSQANPTLDKVRIELTELYGCMLALGETYEQAYFKVGQHLVERIEHGNLFGEENQLAQEPLVPESEKRSLLTAYDTQKAKRIKPESAPKEQRFVGELMPEMNGRNFFWYQQPVDSDSSESVDSTDSNHGSHYDPSSTQSLASDKDFDLDDSCPTAKISRVSTNEEHIALLKQVFREAERHVVIATYGISIDILNELTDDIQRCNENDIRIIFYNSNRKKCSKEVEAFIEKYSIIYDQVNTHSKFVCLDSHIIAIGSFNWLSSDYKRYENNYNGTIVLENSPLCASIGTQLILYMRQYAYLRDKNRAAFKTFRDIGTTNNAISYALDFGNKVTYLPTLDAHRHFISATLELARDSIMLSCPFINKKSDFFRELSPRHITKAANRGVKVTIYCQPSHINEFKRTFGHVITNHNNIKLIPISGLHQKTLVVDDHLIAEGSFNWTSASRDESGRFHNNESTLVCEGSMAKPLIDSFHLMMKQSMEQVTQVSNSTSVSALRQ